MYGRLAFAVAAHRTRGVLVMMLAVGDINFKKMHG
jgi:ABC-type polysaccharide/polyol phosphate transport system ATPase subunit